MLSLLIISVVILIIVAAAVYFWLRSSKYSTLVSLMNRLKDDTSKPFEECKDIDAHLKLLKKELDQLLKNSKDKDKTRKQIEEVVNRRVDPKIKGDIGIWIETNLQRITARVGCIREIRRDINSKYISVKKPLEDNMVKIRPIMKTNFKSCDQFLKLHNDLNSEMKKNLLKDPTHQTQMVDLMQHRMRAESVEEEYTNPLGKDEDLGQYISNLHLETCKA